MSRPSVIPAFQPTPLHKQGQELRSEQTVIPLHEQHHLYLFCVLAIQKHLSKVDFERSGRGQEPSRGHKFSILENFLSIRDFTSQTLASFPSDLVGACLPQTLPGTSTTNWKLSVIKYQQQIPLSNDSPVRVCLYWNCVLLLLSTSKEFSYCDAMLCCTVYMNQRDLLCRISIKPGT